MRHIVHTRFAIAVLVGAVVVIGGTSLVIASEPGPPDGEGIPEGVDFPRIRADANKTQGVTEAGGAYTIAYQKESDGRVCYRAEANQAAAVGCLPPLDGEASLRAGMITLGSDLFVLALVDDTVAKISARRLDNRGSGSSKAAPDLGDRRLLHAVINAPQDTLPRTDSDMPVPPGVEVEAVDAGGATVANVSIPAHMPTDGTVDPPRP